MKIECIKKTINLNKIHWAINCFRADHKGEYPSYIIMNYETKAKIVNDYYFETIIRWGEGDRLFNIPVAFNEGLKFGEVDIV